LGNETSCTINKTSTGWLKLPQKNKRRILLTQYRVLSVGAIILAQYWVLSDYVMLSIYELYPRHFKPQRGGKCVVSEDKFVSMRGDSNVS